jgi:hypothetical protein
MIYGVTMEKADKVTCVSAWLWFSKPDPPCRLGGLSTSEVKFKVNVLHM